MVVLIAFGIVCAVVGVLIGRGMRLNKVNRAALIAQADAGHAPEALINTRTGEVLDPGTAEWRQAVAKGKVIFE